MIVADVNLLAYVLVPGPTTQQAERVRAKEKVWVAPKLLPHELLNVLARYVRRGDISRDEAIRAYRRGLAITEISVMSPDPVAVLRLAERSGCTTYDMEYVWLAMELGLPLVTADKQVIDAFPDVAINFSSFA